MINRIDGNTPAYSKPDTSIEKKRLGKFNVTQATDYDLGLDIKVKNFKGQGPQSANSCSCTCDNTCSGCTSTDSGCYQTQNGCYGTQEKCGYGD